MADVKDELSPAAVAGLADALTSSWPALPRHVLEDGIGEALAPLRLSERVALVAGRLATALPNDFDEAADVVGAAIGHPGLDGWISLPVGTWVAEAGLGHPERALDLLAALTPLFSSEGPIRPFIERHPEVTMARLRAWAEHPDEHVRRLVSEGTRPRLPWAPQLRGFVADPTPAVALLDLLVEDPSPYVRRSVANHLNDITKDHPELALAAAERWWERGDGARWVVGHGLRTLVKRGDPRALGLLGADTAAEVRLTAVAVEPALLPIGAAATLTFTLELAGDGPAEAVIDYRVTYQGARGPNAPKVFKLTRRRLEPGRPTTISRRHRFEHVSIRRIRPGPHPIEVQVNGRVLGGVVVEVVEAGVEAPDTGPR